MKDPTHLPMALAQANHELQARIAELTQSGGQHWYELVQRLVNDGIVEGGTGMPGLLQAQDWQQLLSMPADAYWRQLQQHFGGKQPIAQIAVAAQASFALGVQDALAAWQRDTIAALDDAGLATPALDPSWSSLFAGWEAALPDTAFAAAPEPARKAAVKKAPAKKAPAKKTPAKKASTKKAPAKKASAKKAPTKKASAKKAPAHKAGKTTRKRG